MMKLMRCGEWRDINRGMRSLRFLPLVFIVGVDGFAMFLPYVGLVCAAAYIIARAKPRPQTV